MKAMIDTLMEILKTHKFTNKEARAIINTIGILEKVDDLADCYVVFERDQGNDERN